MIRPATAARHVLAGFGADGILYFESVERVRSAAKDAFKGSEGFSLTYLPFISRALVDAIREYPEVNASFGDSDSAGGTTNVMFTLPEAQRLIAEPGKLD